MHGINRLFTSSVQVRISLRFNIYLFEFIHIYVFISTSILHKNVHSTTLYTYYIFLPYNYYTISSNNILHRIVGEKRLIKGLLYVISGRKKVTTTGPSNTNGISKLQMKVKVQWAIRNNICCEQSGLMTNLNTILQSYNIITFTHLILKYPILQLQPFKLGTS